MLQQGFGKDRPTDAGEHSDHHHEVIDIGRFLVPIAAWGQNEIQHGPGLDTRADGRGDLVRQLPPRGQSGSGGSVVQGNGISYHNGPVMRNGVNIYYIWYGDWSKDPTANAILTNYAQNVGGSPYFNINTTYGDTSGNVPNTPSTVKYASAVNDSGSLGTSLSDSSIWTLVTNALKTLPADPNGVYFVLTAPYVAETSGFLSQYCGWHSANYFGSTTIKYAFVGNAAASLGSCSVQSTSPNGDAAADAMVSVIAHELEEAATDPELSAWYDSSGAENADKCAWTFGATYPANGAQANMKIGSMNYLIQQNWVNAGGGYCGLSYVGTPDFSLSVSPASQTVTPGQTSGGYTVTASPLNGWSNTVTYSVTGGLPSGASAMRQRECDHGQHDQRHARRQLQFHDFRDRWLPDAYDIGHARGFRAGSSNLQHQHPVEFTNSEAADKRQHLGNLLRSGHAQHRV